MKVFLKGYCKLNLGDDLFFKIISNRYSDDFYMIYNRNNSSLKKIKNLHLIRIPIISKVCGLLNISNPILKYYEKKSDVIVNIGGSIFVENGSRFNKNTLNNEYVLGANFGPYKSQNFLNEYKKYIFPKAKDICFRDYYSYNLFKKIKNVRFAPDIVFTLKSPEKIVSNNKVLITVVNPKMKGFNNLNENYENKMVELIEYYQNKFEVVLMSFCKAEGDEIIVKSIVKKLKSKQNVTTYYYRGNIDEALAIIKSSKIIVGSRYHANILGLLFNKYILPISYNEKLINQLRDLGYCGKIYDIKNLNDIIINEISIGSLTDTKIKKIICNANKQFEKLDMILKEVRDEQ